MKALRILLRKGQNQTSPLKLHGCKTTGSTRSSQFLQPSIFTARNTSP
uniref:Uncharacterized protein n=1 Tax=Arundo donax TaxID=35708 RepID=A0A0A9B6Z6_ARUDO